ncbi:MAG: extracellular solute-binding protein [Cellvibrionaceae bacterium]|nr:extracellular solute-binding protein [Cellvibrionaceae bacterium]
MLNRRRFIKHTLGAGALSSLALQSPLATAANKDLSDLHQQLVAQVNSLRGKRDVSLTLLHPDGCQANLIPVINQFRQATGITIKLIKAGVDDINSTLIFNATLQQPLFDIALPATFGIPDLVNANALRPLNDFVREYEPAHYKDYQLYDYGDYFNGDFYGYQTDGDTYLLFYNKDMLNNADNRQRFFNEQGYPLSIPKTWEQLDTMIRFFHQPEKQQYGGCLFRTPGYGAWEWWSRFHAKGYYPLDDTLTPQINNAAGIAALEEMVAISSYLHPKTASDGLFDNWATFAAGKTFCNIGWGGSQKYFNSDKSSVRGKLYYAPAPGGIIKGELIDCPIFNWGWNYVVSSLSKEPEIAYLFTLYACSPTLSTLSVQQKGGFFDPFREEHYSDKAIKETYSEAFLRAHKESIHNSIPDFYLQNQSTYLAALQENIYLAYQGSLSAQQALDITATEWQRITEKVGHKKQQAFWLALKAKYPEKLRAVLS